MRGRYACVPCLLRLNPTLYRICVFATKQLESTRETWKGTVPQAQARRGAACFCARAWRAGPVGTWPRDLLSSCSAHLRVRTRLCASMHVCGAQSLRFGFLGTGKEWAFKLRVTHVQHVVHCCVYQTGSQITFFSTVHVRWYSHFRHESRSTITSGVLLLRRRWANNLFV